MITEKKILGNQAVAVARQMIKDYLAEETTIDQSADTSIAGIQAYLTSSIPEIKDAATIAVNAQAEIKKNLIIIQEANKAGNLNAVNTQLLIVQAAVETATNSVACITVLALNQKKRVVLDAQNAILAGGVLIYYSILI